jgi:hypothetical protein
MREHDFECGAKIREREFRLNRGTVGGGTTRVEKLAQASACAERTTPFATTEPSKAQAAFPDAIAGVEKTAYGVLTRRWFWVGLY